MLMGIEFEWDDANISHIARHGILPYEAEEVVTGKPIELGAGFEKGEFRITQIGETAAGRVVTVVLTERNSKIRVVTSYPATRRLCRIYLERKGVTRDEGI
jgi:uncharacterized DUF497 family protein